MKINKKLLISILSIVCGILVGVIILAISGKDIGALFHGLIKGSTGFDIITGDLNLRYFGEFLVSAMPIILTGLAVGFAYRCGMFNIGCEGQVIMGSLASCIVGIMIPMPNIVAPIVCLLVGGLAGALWAFVPGILKSKYNISEVVTGIMLNYTALYSANYFLKILPGSTTQRTVDIAENAGLGNEFFKQITNNSRLHFGFIVVLVAVFVYWFIIEKTTFGYSLRATGLNKDGAKYAGIKVNKNIVISIMVSGFLAGLAGAIILQGTFGYGRTLASPENFGFDGIAVALVGGCNAIGTLFAGLLFALLKVTQPLLQTSGIPREIGDIISSFIVFFVAIQYIFDKRLFKRHKVKRGKT